MATPLPDGPWQKLGADVCEHKNQQYLVIVDYYSRFFELVHLPDLTSKTLIFKFRNVFARHGLPYVLRTDNARSFRVKNSTNSLSPRILSMHSVHRTSARATVLLKQLSKLQRSLSNRKTHS